MTLNKSLRIKIESSVAQTAQENPKPSKPLEYHITVVLLVGCFQPLETCHDIKNVSFLSTQTDLHTTLRINLIII